MILNLGWWFWTQQVDRAPIKILLTLVNIRFTRTRSDSLNWRSILIKFTSMENDRHIYYMKSHMLIEWKMRFLMLRKIKHLCRFQNNMLYNWWTENFVVKYTKYNLLKKESSMFSERAEIIGKTIAEFVIEMIRDNLKEELY